MNEKLYRVRPLVFRKLQRKRSAGFEVWEAGSAIGTFRVVGHTNGSYPPERKWQWEHPPDAGDSCGFYADDGHATYEEAVAAAVAWYTRQVTVGLEEVSP